MCERCDDPTLTPEKYMAQLARSSRGAAGPFK